MPPKIVIQDIRTGAPEECRRVTPGKKPEVLPLPDPAPRLAPHRVFHHRPGWRPGEDLVLDQPERPIVVGCVTIDELPDALSVEFAWTWSAGAPARWWARKTMRVRVNEWAQIIYNGRHAEACCGSAWYYEKTVVNVGWFETLEPDAFTRRPPDQRYTVLSRLW
jgi:hypothetical protein